jgi:hypothetical protein
MKVSTRGELGMALFFQLICLLVQLASLILSPSWYFSLVIGNALVAWSVTKPNLLRHYKHCNAFCRVRTCTTHARTRHPFLAIRTLCTWSSRLRDMNGYRTTGRIELRKSLGGRCMMRGHRIASTLTEYSSAYWNACY